MDLILLAAGFATRLEPLTLNQPKHLLPVKGGKFIDPLIDQLELVKDRFGKKVIITNDRYFEKFNDFAKGIDQGYEVYKDGVTDKNSRLGTIGDLLCVIEQADLKGDLMVIASDYIMPDFDFARFIDWAKSKDASATVTREEDDVKEVMAGSCLLVDDQDKIIRFEEKPKQPFSSLYGVPYYIVKKNDLKFVEKLPKELWDNCGQIAKAVSENSAMYAIRHNCEPLHMTSLEDYNRIRQ